MCFFDHLNSLLLITCSFNLILSLLSLLMTKQMHLIQQFFVFKSDSNVKLFSLSVFDFNVFNKVLATHSPLLLNFQEVLPRFSIRYLTYLATMIKPTLLVSNSCPVLIPIKKTLKHLNFAGILQIDSTINNHSVKAFHPYLSFSIIFALLTLVLKLEIAIFFIFSFSKLMISEFCRNLLKWFMKILNLIHFTKNTLYKLYKLYKNNYF